MSALCVYIVVIRTLVFHFFYVLCYPGAEKFTVSKRRSARPWTGFKVHGSRPVFCVICIYWCAYFFSYSFVKVNSKRRLDDDSSAYFVHGCTRVCVCVTVYYTLCNVLEYSSFKVQQFFFFFWKPVKVLSRVLILIKVILDSIPHLLLSIRNYTFGFLFKHSRAHTDLPLNILKYIIIINRSRRTNSHQPVIAVTVELTCFPPLITCRTPIK